MSKNTDNGLLWALGAAGALALGSMVVGRASGSRSSHSCSSCGSANCATEKEDEARGSYLLRQRFGARAGFVVPLSRIYGYCGRANERGKAFLAFYQNEARQILREGDRKRFEALDAYQRTLLEAAHVAPDPEDKEGAGGLMTLSTYAKEKLKDWRSRHRGSSFEEESKVEMDYLASLYAKRAWTIYILQQEAAHHTGDPVTVEVPDAPDGKPTRVTLLSEPQREPVYGEAEKGKSAPLVLFSDLTFTLTVPVRMESTNGLSAAGSVQTYGEMERALQAVVVAQPERKGMAFPTPSVSAERGSVSVDGVVASDADQESELLDEAEEDEDADLMKGLSGAPILSIQRGDEPVGVFFVAMVSGSMAFPYGMKSIALVTCTSKMASPSFGLPAGAASTGGTCPSGDIGLPTSVQARRQAPMKTPEVKSAVLRRQKLIDGANARIVKLKSELFPNPRKKKPITQEFRAGVDKKIENSLREISRNKQEIQKLESGVYVPVKRKGASERLVPSYICAVCYAMGANYGYANNMTQQAARKKWIEDLLDGKGGVDRAAANLVQMIWTYANHTRHNQRACQEIGTWSNKVGRILMPQVQTRTRMPVDPTPLRIDQLTIRPMRLNGETVVPQAQAVRQQSVPDDTVAFFQALSERGVIDDGDVAGFFRLHDSGDFGIGIPYQKAWLRAAESLPGVQFWAPTRQWGTLVSVTDPKAQPWRTKMKIFSRFNSPPSFRLRSWKRGSGGCWKDVPEGSPVNKSVPTDLSPGEGASDNPASTLKAFVPSTSMSVLKALSALSNFTLRPSSLYVRRTISQDIAIPHIDGLNAGSGVAAKIGDQYPVMNDTRGVRAYQCPVYTKMDFKDAGGKVTQKEAKSCRTANCRACWLAKDLPVFYGAH